MNPGTAYYKPIEGRDWELKKKQDEPDSQMILDILFEIYMHGRYSDCYGYRFKIMKKKD
jgi:hypothetical protein